jgi:Protein of unknown function (DUF4239)
MGSIFLVIFITGIVMASSVFFMMLVRKKIGHAILEKHNDVAGFIYAVVGIVYAVLLAFVVIVVWEFFRTAEAKVYEEVKFMSALFRDAGVFGEPHHAAIQNEIVNYTNIVINEEWPLMNEGKSSTKALDSLRQIFYLYKKIQPQNDYERIWYQETIAQLNNFSSARNQRILAGKAAVPGFMWIVLIFGGMITIGFSFLFGTINTWAHILMVASLAGIITLTLLMIFALDHAFQAIIVVEPDAFIEQLSYFKNYLKPQQ